MIPSELKIQLFPWSVDIYSGNDHRVCKPPTSYTPHLNTPCLYNSFNANFHLCLQLPTGFFFSHFVIKIVYVILISPLCATYPSLVVKRRDVKLTAQPPSIAEVKDAWSYTSTPPIRLHGVVLS